VAVGPADRLREAADPLQSLGNSGAIRGILVPQDGDAPAGAQVAGNVVMLTGLKQTFVDNAVAALRLSSLPTVIWWRGGPVPLLENLVKLADRVVLDADPPDEVWRCAADRFGRSAFSDIRWTRLTRWRALMAQFFDMPDVRDAASSFKRLHVTGSDRPSAVLFAAWMQTSLQWSDEVGVEIDTGRDAVPIRCITLAGDALQLKLCLGPSGRCVESTARIGEQSQTSRVVSLDDDSLTALLSAELRIRSRDEAFERALRAAVAAA
jgi:glucose-6-phosphate dehydrogenase assembly protein OpcA